MEIKRMLEVVTIRFERWNPITSMFGDNGFRIEISNQYGTGRILIRGIHKMDGQIEWNVAGEYTDADTPRINEVKKVVLNALV